jgi:PAS domain S-box-containing protein
LIQKHNEDIRQILEKFWKLQATARAQIVTLAILINAIILLALFFAQPMFMGESQTAVERKAHGVRDEQKLEAALKEIVELKAALKQKQFEITSNRLAAIVDSSDDAIISKDLNSIVTTWNKGAEKIFGYTADEMIGSSILRLIPTDRQDEENHILGKIKHGENVEHFETLRQTKDGRLIDVSVTASPIKDATSKVTGVSKVARDISEQKRAEGQLKTSLKEIGDLKTALDEHAIVAITDAQGKITYVNDKFCAISKYPREELMGRDHRIINSGYHSKQFIRDLWTTITCGKVWHGEIKNKAKDDSFYWVDTTIVPFLNEQGKPRQYVAIRADITARKAASAEVVQLNAELEQRVAQRTVELEAANKELEAFSYSISHDLRAPLRAVNGFAGIVLEDFSAQLPEEGKRHLERIRKGGERMGELIDNLLTFSRLSRQSVNRQLMDISKLVQNVLDELKPQRDGRQIEIKIGELPACHGDPALLKQVWVNLISNAIKYTRGREPAIVEIGCARENGEDVFFVRDNGAGFDMQYANKLFGVFQRLHRADEFEGTGVGLAIVQRIVHRHGGRVWAEAKVNEGATFYFSIEGESKL